MNEFKAWAAEKGFDENPWFTDTFWLRWCRARKFDLEKMQLMFTNYMKYREEHGIDNILATVKFDKGEALKDHYPRGYCGIDKLGRPVYVERHGLINIDKVYEIVSDEELLEGYY